MEFPESLHLPLGDWVDAFVNWLVIQYGDAFEALSNSLLFVLVRLERFLGTLPWWSVVLVVALLAWHASRRWVLAVGLAATMFLIGALGLWDLAIQTLALMIVATTISVLIGVPTGILMSRSDRLRAFLLPLLDAMQTMPSFVYLIPALMLFGLGKVPAVFATVIYAVPPAIRLTDLGIRLVDKEVLEASEAFGATARQKLLGVQLPLALPNIMAGINQTTMMALSMVVIASMIGARGLGEQVLLGIQRLDVGQGTEAGVAIVALAIVMDRITQAYGKRTEVYRKAGE
ncbi:ABC transporter permease [Marinithermus hydrothermalis]|uniref:ABC-type transporter, integral membrane subunit n=1 Tax=Marinithermus hydrothermalis (strain DSM 14884 / JCM 11576 / T1) TaxID=869210 RepID=F2NKQ7_MARHT|nr:proline/glycine betaine ABC transporter permease [Marinithermus hydrothermalis]AEB10820.1 ABC-type transporter, integral membrane subunit [Marinithermus hydrothermalis DSM 14884]